MFVCGLLYQNILGWIILKVRHLLSYNFGDLRFKLSVSGNHDFSGRVAQIYCNLTPTQPHSYTTSPQHNLTPT